MKQEGTANRTMYFDCLRLAATLAVIILHVSGQNWSAVGVSTFEWQVFNVFDSIVRWSVPIFVMISGALFLGGQQSISRIYRKNIVRIATAFVFWSAAYALLAFFNGAAPKGVVFQFITGHYHMWFLYMIVGLYMLVPLLRPIVQSASLTKYYMALAFVFTMFLPQAISLLSLRSPNLSATLNQALGNLKLTFGMSGYFIAGYYLSKNTLPKKWTRLIYVLGLAGFFATICLSAIVSHHLQAASDMFYGYLTVNVLLESLAVFVFAKEHLQLSKASVRCKAMIQRFAQYSFGAYLVHAMILELLDSLFSFNTLSMNPLLSVPAITGTVLVVSFALSALIHQIPVLKKYIV